MIVTLNILFRIIKSTIVIPCVKEKKNIVVFVDMQDAYFLLVAAIDNKYWFADT
jgi:hypothetical protein